MLSMQKNVTLRKVGHSLFFTIPADFVRAYRLSPGDTVSIDADEDGATLKFYRVETTLIPALRESESPQPIANETQESAEGETAAMAE
jgi:hypothetical protein